MFLKSRAWRILHQLSPYPLARIQLHILNLTAKWLGNIIFCIYRKDKGLDEYIALYLSQSGKLDSIKTWSENRWSAVKTTVQYCKNFPRKYSKISQIYTRGF